MTYFHRRSPGGPLGLRPLPEVRVIVFSCEAGESTEVNKQTGFLNIFEDFSATFPDDS